MTPPICDYFINAFMRVVECGYGDEVVYIRELKPIEQQTHEDFRREFVWVILNSGFKEQYARVIFDRFWDAINGKTAVENPFSVIAHAGKRKAIIECFAKSPDWWIILQNCHTPETQIEFIRTLPWMGGKALGYHLARNLGIDTVKPDRHLIKLTEHFGYSSPLEMCKDIQANLNGGMFLTKEKLGTIDVILWRSMNLTGGKIE